MLTIRENLLETIHGGNPDRFVDQFEFIPTIPGSHPINTRNTPVTMGGPMVQNLWGVWMAWKDGQLGPFPVHDKEHIILQDISKWREIIKMPDLKSVKEEEWEAPAKASAAVNRKEVFACVGGPTGVWDQLHYFQGMVLALENMILEPGYTKEICEYLTEYELMYAEQVCKYVKPDALFHHDDWGSQKSTFFSPEMYEQFFLPAYKQIYGYYKSHGVELVVHHADSYAATLVPFMIECQIDIFQGCMEENDVPALVKKYGGKISFMGDINSGKLDRPDWETIKPQFRKEVERAVRNNGKHYYIPCLTRGGGASNYPGVYELVSEEINKLSKEMF